MPRNRDRRGRIVMLLPARRQCLGRGGQRGDQKFVILIGQRRPRRHRFGQFTDPVHQAQHRAHRRRIGNALARADVRQHIFGRMAQPLEPGQVQEAAATLDRMEEAENRIEPVPVRRIGFPGDDFPRQRLQRFLGLGYEFL